MQRAADKWELARWPRGLYQLHPMGANLPGEVLLKLWGGQHIRQDDSRNHKLGTVQASPLASSSTPAANLCNL